MSSSVYNHRSLAPNPGMPRGAQEGLLRLNEAFDTIKSEYDLLLNEVGVVKSQRDEAESKMAAQVNELNIIRQTLYDLEGNHHKIRTQYEDELGRLRLELQQYKNMVTNKEDRASTNAPNAAPGPREPRYRDHGPPPTTGGGPGASSPSLGSGPGREQMRGPGPSGPSHFHPDDKPIREERRGRVHEENVPREPYPGDPRMHGEKPPGRMNTDPSILPASRTKAGPEYDGREYGPARHERDDRMSIDPPAPGPGPAVGPPPTAERSTPVETKAVVPAPAKLSAGQPGAGPPPPTGNEFLEMDNIPPEFKNTGSAGDWFAIYNPTLPRRSPEVSLQHTLQHESVVCCVRFSADGKYLATGCNRTAQIYDVTTGIKTCVLIDDNATKTGDLYIRSVCFSPDGKYLATGAEDKQIRIWDISKRRIRNVFDGHQQEIYSLDFSANGNVIVSGSGDKTARIWDMENGTSKILSISDSEAFGADAGVTSVAISPDGKYVAAGSLDTVVRIWDVATGRLLDRLRGHGDSVYSVAFTPDGKGLVSGSLDKTLKYWDVSTLGKDGPRECLMNFVGHRDYVLSVAVSHDGKYIVSGSKDRGVQFWDSKTAIVQCMLQGHKNSVISIDVSPKGNMLATGSGDWHARIWSYQ